MGTLEQDLRFGLRMLRKDRGFTAVAVVTLALAIGANTAIFSVIYPALLRPLPYRQPDRLVTLGENRRQLPCCSSTSSYPDYLDWIRGSKSFVSLAGFAADGYTLTGSGDPKPIFGAMVTPNFFATLGVKPMLGRDFVPGEDLPGEQGPAVAIITYSFWRNDLSGDPNIIGRTLRLDNKPVSVVGVLPREFEFALAGSSPLWVPLHINSDTSAARNARWLNVVGRLAPGVGPDAARAEMEGITARLAQQYPREDASIYITMKTLWDATVGDIRPLLLILFGAVMLVLLIACANIANLLLTRSLDRHKEFAIRVALGAGRGHILLQLLTESLLLAMMGAAVGLGFAAWGVRLLVRAIPEAQLQSMPFLRDAGINFSVLLFLFGVTLVTAVLFGLGPGLALARTPVAEVLKDEARAGTSRTHSDFRNVMVVCEIVISMLLLAGGGLMLQSLRNLLQQDPGFLPQHLLTFDLNLPGDTYPRRPAWPYDSQKGLGFEHQFIDRLRSLPGVQNVSAVSGLPVSENRSTNRFILERQPAAEGREESCITRRVDAGYFRTMKVPLLAGRFFDPSDGPDAPAVAIVNQAWVKHYAGGASPIGQRVRLTFFPSEPFREIVGVIGNVAEDDLAAAAPPVMYFPLDQDSSYTVYLNYVVRTAQPPAALVNSVRDVLHGLDPRLAIIQPQSMDEFINRTPAVFLRRYPFYLIGTFAGLALVLAIVGLYGLISYSVLQRTREIGIRLALGAQRENILRLVLRQGAFAAGLGVGIGLIASLLLTRVMASLLYGITFRDWPLLAGLGLFLTLSALTASYLPARRASQVDPMAALRTGNVPAKAGLLAYPKRQKKREALEQWEK
jgi:putative ABC transport system permease protein